MYYYLYMKRSRNGSTLKQLAFARKLLNADGPNKKEIALSVGYSPSVAKNVESQIENSEGFQNAVIKLAAESNNLVLAVMAEYKARGLTTFTNKDLNGAMNAIAQGWEKFNKHRAPNGSSQPENPIKRAIFQKIENQTINYPAQKSDGPKVVENVDLDF